MREMLEDLTNKGLESFKNALPSRELCFNIVAPSLEEGQEKGNTICHWE